MQTKLCSSLKTTHKIERGDTMLDFINGIMFYEQGDGGGGDPAPEADPKKEGDPEPEPKGDDPKPYKSFSSEEEYLNSLKSERSKAKNELLKEMGVSSVDEAKSRYKKADELESEVNTYKTKNSELQEKLVLTENGVKDDYAEEALSLAKSKVGEDKDLSTALGEVINKFPMMASKTQTTKPNVGGDKNDGKPDEDDQGKVKEGLKTKYPWLKI